MPGKRFTVEQIVAKLREAERLQGQGQTIPPVCKCLGVSEQTFYRWRIKFGALKEDEAQRLKALEPPFRANGYQGYSTLVRVHVSAGTTPVKSAVPGAQATTPTSTTVSPVGLPACRSC